MAKEKQQSTFLTEILDGFAFIVDKIEKIQKEIEEIKSDYLFLKETLVRKD
jgi:hypothetical protein